MKSSFSASSLNLGIFAFWLSKRHLDSIESMCTHLRASLMASYLIRLFFSTIDSLRDSDFSVLSDNSVILEVSELSAVSISASNIFHMLVRGSRRCWIYSSLMAFASIFSNILYRDHICVLIVQFSRFFSFPAFLIASRYIVQIHQIASRSS